MEPMTRSEPEIANRLDEDRRIHAWRTERLQQLGLPAALAGAFAGLVDWHELATIVERGCPPMLALEIVR